MRARIVTICLIFLLAMGSNQALAAIPKAGAPCAKAGLKSGSLICAKVNGKLKWKIVKKSQSISFRAPQTASISEKSVTIDYSATSKRAVAVKNLTPSVCTLESKELLPTGIPGLCTIALNQRGNAYFRAAKSVRITVTFMGTNDIEFRLPDTISISQLSYKLVATSSSGQPVTYSSIAEDVCSVSGTTLILVKVGICQITASQSGGTYFPAANPITQRTEITFVANVIKFELPSALLLGQGSYSLSATSSSNLLVIFSSSPKEVCTVTNTTLMLVRAGTCQVTASQSGSDLYAPATPVTANVEVSTARVLADLPDQSLGFQIKAIYVVPSDGVDNSYDINGRISTILREGTSFLTQELGLTLPIDSSSLGYDISFLKSSKPTSYFLSSSNSYDALLQETKFLDAPSPNRKDFVFFVDVPYVKNSGVCGFATIRGISAVVAVGSESCTQKTTTFQNFASMAWVHEAFHNFGVTHVPDSCDLMASNSLADGPLCASDVKLTIDRAQKFYVKSSNYGQDILKLRVWTGYTADQGLFAECWEGSPVPRADGLLYAYCPTGTRAIGALTMCWNNISSIDLDELVDGTWTSLGAGSYFSQFWGGDLYNWRCSDSSYGNPWKQVTVDIPGVRHYRWLINDQVVQEMNIIWVK